MQSAPTTLPRTPDGGLTSGIDWASSDHAVAVVNTDGLQVDRFITEHNQAGLLAMTRRLRKLGVTEVAIERPDGPVVDALLQAGFTVVVISPNQVKNLRGRYGSAGNKDDRFDAFVLADTLRTDRARLRPLVPDSPQTVALRQTCRARKDLVAHRVAVANQLRAHLQLVFPARSACSPTSTPRSACGSWTASTARSERTGSHPNASRRGWPRSATAAAPTRPCCTHG